MTYSEYRNQFSTVNEFRKAYGKLSYEEVHFLVEASQAQVHVKAAMMSSWKSAKEEMEKGGKLE